MKLSWNLLYLIHMYVWYLLSQVEPETGVDGDEVMEVAGGDTYLEGSQPGMDPCHQVDTYTEGSQPGIDPCYEVGDTNSEGRQLSPGKQN